MDIQSPVIQKGRTYAGLFGGIFRADVMESVGAGITQSLQESNAELKEEAGEQSAVLGEATVKNMLRGIVIEMSTYFAPVFGVNILHPGMDNSAEEAIKSQVQNEVNNFFDQLDKVRLFADDALIVRTKLDENGYPKTVHNELNINLNFEELTKEFGGYWNEDITGEAADLDMTVLIDLEFDKLNQDVAIEFPELTKENSENLMEGNQLPGIDVNQVTVVQNEKAVPMGNQPFIRDGAVYVPLREALNLYGVADEDILWDNGAVNVNLFGDSVTMQVNSREFQINGETVALNSEVVLHGDYTYVPTGLLQRVNAGNLTNAFSDEAGNLIGGVVVIHAPVRRQTAVRYLYPSDLEPMWVKMLYQASDRAGAAIETESVDPVNFIQKMNLMIAAGEPCVLIGRFDREYLDRLAEIEAVNSIISLKDDYKVIIPNAVKNPNVAMEVIKIFIDLIGQQ